MFCLRCGNETGDDQELCVRCSHEVVEDRVAEKDPGAPGESNKTRCRSCRKQINSDFDVCPHCGVEQPASIL